MFVKLNFSTNKDVHQVHQILNAIINNVNINNMATLSTAAASWNANIVSGLDYTTSEIIRTVEPTTVKSHLADNAINGRSLWTMEFQVYDASDRKYYIQFDGSGSDTTTLIRVGNTIMSGNMTANQASMSIDLGVNGNTSGTPVVLSSTAPAQLLTSVVNQYSSVTANNYNNVRTYWMYLTNDCLITASTHGTSSNLGFNATYNTGAAYSGPHIFSQYQRYDYHNTNANGVIPLMFTNLSRTTIGGGFGCGFTQFGANDWDRVESVNYSTGQVNDTAFRVFNFIDAHPQVGTSWPLTAFPAVNWGSGSRNTEQVALTGKTVIDTATSTTAQYGRLIHTTSQTRYPSSDLRNVGYGMLPLRWTNSYRFNRGGNATTRGRFYIFNGDYFPGDTFTHENKIYMIWPTFVGYSARVGVAVPKE